MSKIQYQFKRTTPLRFLSHLDQQRLFQRAFRRANLPIEYSQGFNPHPKMSFALAMSVGLTSDCEYGEVNVSEDLNSDEFIAQMNAVLPEGLQIVSAKVCEDGTRSLSSSIEKSYYALKVKIVPETSFLRLADIIKSYLRLDDIKMEKRNKKGKMVEKNIRPFIESISVSQLDGESDRVNIEMTLIYIDQQCVKPERVLESINNLYGDVFIVDPTIECHRQKLLLKAEI
jgi:radical SAM-linked protein